jgi:NADPH:quinone reductase-like Zn-dependent oxidoreductase
MKAILLDRTGGPEVLRRADVPDPSPGKGEVVVRLRAAALNHRDVWIRKGRYPKLRFPIVLGSDGAGDVIDAGLGVPASLIGKAVVIDPAFQWGDNPRAQGDAFHILGQQMPGTYAERIVVPATHVHEKPAHLSYSEAAALPLAFVTAYRALATRAAVQPRERVLITGIGGGVATSALVLASALGAEVFVTSGSDEKIARAMSHGAAGGVNHHDPEWPKIFATRFGRRPDVVVDGAGGETFDRALDILTPGGRLVSYGATLGAAPQVEVRRIFWKQLSVLGSTMGTRDDFAAMIACCVSRALTPIVDVVLPLSNAAEAHQRMETGAQFGKIVLDVT